MKLQSSIEYLTMFAAAVLILVIVIAVISNVLSNNTPPLPSTCYLSPEMNCLQLTVATNGISTEGIIIFTNGVGQTLQFGSNSFLIYPTAAQKSYLGECFPYNAIPGAQVVCNATINAYTPSLGAQLQPKFEISYSVCPKGSCAPGTLNTIGTGTIYVSSAVSNLYLVHLLGNPDDPSAMITLDGVPYPSNSYVYFIKSVTYSIYADPPPDNSFIGWTSTGGVSIASASAQGTSATATATNSVIVANFNAVP